MLCVSVDACRYLLFISVTRVVTMMRYSTGDKGIQIIV